MNQKPPIRSIVIVPFFKYRLDNSRSKEAKVSEITGLAQALDLEVDNSFVISIGKISPATYIGTGALDEIKQYVATNQIDLVIVDAAITSIHQRNIEKALKVKVIDRTGLILEIFGKRAQTAEGRLQVELASLMYQKTRLVKAWSHLERQRGGLSKTGGPGESQLELDKRMINEKIYKLQKDLEDVKKTRNVQRKGRKDYPLVSLVGYTNAGKSTLFNTLSKGGVLAKDMLFATLDTTMRVVEGLGAPKVILSDTVGFIADLPTELVAAFRATLEELENADLILNVHDPSNEEWEAQAEDVTSMLKYLNITVPIIDVYNKIDNVALEDLDILRSKLSRSEKPHVFISAITGEGISDLLKAIDEILRKNYFVATVKIPMSNGALVAWIYEQAQVLNKSEEDEFLIFQIKIPPSYKHKILEYIVG